MKDGVEYTQESVGNNSRIIPGALVVRVARVQTLLVVVGGGMILSLCSPNKGEFFFSGIVAIIIGASFLLLLIDVLSRLTYSLLQRRTLAGFFWASANLVVLGVGFWILSYLRNQPELILYFIFSFASLLLLLSFFLTLRRGS